MLARGMKPKLSLTVATATSQATRPALGLLTPLTPLRSPMSPRSPAIPNSPTALNTKLNQRGMATLQPPSYAYANNSTSRSILKKSSFGSSSGMPVGPRQLQFSDKPLVYCVTPIEDEEYYGTYRKMSRDERRWQSRP